ncbi:MAG: hypothetical protein LLG20_00525 [Acidobacteriales bacterium]|nr:hypothetical protein [Terriglobales bacterium]
MAQIAEAQHVLTPSLVAYRQLEMQRIGVNLASTFPGFCQKHEQLFAEFETTGHISSHRHFALQAFRTVCGEIARKRHAIEGLESYLEAYRRARFGYFAAAVQTVRSTSRIKSLSIKGDKLESNVSSKIKKAKASLRELEGELYDELFAYIDGQRCEPCLDVFLLPYEVPVSLSGLGSLQYEYAGKKHLALCPLGILPQPGSTVAFIGAAWRHAVLVEHYQARMRVSFGALNAMEAWLLHGSDHWFIRPSTWEALPGPRQLRILRTVMSVKQNIASFPRVSVLDAVRRQLIACVLDHLPEAGNNRDFILKCIREESAKLTAPG